MAVLTLDLYRILEAPISDDDLADMLRSQFPGCVVVAGREAWGWVGYVNSTELIPLAYRNVDGPWQTDWSLGPSTEQSVHFLGINPYQADIFLQAFPDRLQKMQRKFRVYVS